MKYSAITTATGLSLLLAAASGAFAEAGTDTAGRIAGVIAEHEQNHPALMWHTDASGAGLATADTPPPVPRAFTRNVGRAWEAAGEGNSPSSNCAGFFNGLSARLANENTESADLADSMLGVDVCYVGVMARYLSVKLAPVDSAGNDCIGEMTAINGHRQVATSLLGDVDADGVLMAYLDGRLDAAMGQTVREACPAHIASIILPVAAD